jgi:hypothetical protein
VGNEPERVEGQDTEAEQPMSLRTRLIAAGLLVVLGFVFVRFAVPPVAADSARPDGHPPGPCWLCHTTTSAAGGPDAP